MALVLRVGTGLITLDLLLGVAHILWPYQAWGQGRSSFFNLGNDLTLASWLAVAQLFGVAVLSMVAFHRRPAGGSWVWPTTAAMALVVSFAELTRIHQIVGFERSVYDRLVLYPAALVVLLLVGWRLLAEVGGGNWLRLRWLVGWMTVWGAAIVIGAVSPGTGSIWWSLTVGFAYLIGTTLLLVGVGLHALRPTPVGPADLAAGVGVAPSIGAARTGWLLFGVAATAMVLLFLQVTLFALLNITADYLTATSIISIALLGGGAGGLVGYRAASRVPLGVILRAAVLLPLGALVAFGAAVTFPSLPGGLLLGAPFLAVGVILAVVYTVADTHLAYFATLVGAGLGALLVDPALDVLREEGSMLAGAALGLLAVGAFAMADNGRLCRLVLVVTMVAAVGVVGIGVANARVDWINVTGDRIRESYPAAEVLFSRSSLIGRYDIVRRSPGDDSLKSYENGESSDTIRPLTVEQHRIDPRIPHTLIDDPSILIIGTAGDAITKTAAFLSDEVYGVEINPDVVDLQSNELAGFNAGSYQGLDVTVTDGRSFVERFNRRVDMITLLNTHLARGPTEGRIPSPEYLYTIEAIHTYLDHLTDRGVLILEEPIAGPDREPPVWRILETMRQALIERGEARPEDHFFIFQWTTDSNNYFQILLKPTPFSPGEVARLDRWLEQVDRVSQVEEATGARVGPINTAFTTVLHRPGEVSGAMVSRIVTGAATPALLAAYNVTAVTDDRPFLFDVDPGHSSLKGAYLILLVLAGAGALGLLVARRRPMAPPTHLAGVVLTGLGYLLCETVLVQRYSRFLGSPVVAFAGVLGSLLLFSGLGSLWSRRLGPRGALRGVVGIVGLLGIHLFVVPLLIGPAAGFPLVVRLLLTVLTLAPLAFLLGIPFPYLLRSGKEALSPSAAAALFAANAAASALAVPLTLNLTAVIGYGLVFGIGAVLYLLVGLVLVGFVMPRFRPAAGWAPLLVIGVLLASPWLLGRAGAVTDGSHPQIYAVSYGWSEFQESEALAGGAATGAVPFAWMFWVIETDDRTLLVDTGFADPALAAAWGIRDHTNPLERLAALGISPDQVDAVILTHAHWDHVGLLGSFPNAEVWIQRREFDHAIGLFADGDHDQAEGTHRADLGALLVAQSEGRLRLVDEDAVIVPGVTVQLAGGHTPGSQIVVVDILEGPAVIAGDETYLYRNNQAHIPVGSAFDQAANLAAIQRLHGLAATPFLILPGHDPLVGQLFPQVVEGVVMVTMSGRSSR